MHIIAVTFCLIFIFINLIGIKEAGRTQVVLVVGLLALMILYVIAGLPAVKVSKFEPFAPNGFAAVFFTTGFVFVSYAGLLKIASVAEEIKNPTRNIPLGMILSLLVVSILYTLIVFVTTGVVEAESLSRSLTPISDGAFIVMGPAGRIALAIAAILAFLSTANAGIMTAARSLVPLSNDGLLPSSLGKINTRFGTPHNSLLVTGLFVIIALFLKLEILVEAASVVLILTNMLSCISVIILRESRIQNYQPSFRAPLYPWLQIIGIVGFGFVLLEMGKEALSISFILIISGLFVYWLYGRIRANREYALLHLVERITAKELTTYTLETELREIIRERDQIVKDRFDHLIEKSIILDIEKPMSAEDFFKLVAKEMSPMVDVEESVLLQALIDREKQSSTVIGGNLAIPHIIIQPGWTLAEGRFDFVQSSGLGRFDILIARCKDGIVFSKNKSQGNQSEAPDWINPNSIGVTAAFVIMGTKDERNFHLYCLAAIAQIVQEPSFEKKWMAARNKEALRDIILLSKRKRR
jgi:amino acid transporter